MSISKVKKVIKPGMMKEKLQNYTGGIVEK